METTSSVVNVNAMLPKRAQCEFEVTERFAIRQVRASYGSYYCLGSSERQAYRHLKEFLRSVLKDGGTIE